MLYLIHEEQRKRITNIYYTSVWKSVSGMLIVVCIVAGICAVPAVLLLRTEGKISEGNITLLESDLQDAKFAGSEAEVGKITNKIHILEKVDTTNVRKTYQDVQRVVESVSGVRVVSIRVDSLTKKVDLVTQVRDKNVAKDLVDALQKTSYKGANLPYSVLSERATFTFAQNLTYE
jgi:hypothetical protein